MALFHEFFYISVTRLTRTFRLYGSHIAHSASPPFHNHNFNELGGNKSCSIFSISKVVTEMLDEII